jgi:hypothetical protein
MRRSIKNTTVADRLLFVLLIAASISGIFISREAMSQSSDVIVEIDGKPVYMLPLTVDKTISVKGLQWDTVIEVKDRKVRIREAHCPNQICVKEGWISKGVIVCLPNRIVVFVGGRRDPGKDLDAVTG